MYLLYQYFIAIVLLKNDDVMMRWCVEEVVENFKCLYISIHSKEWTEQKIARMSNNFDVLYGWRAFYQSLNDQHFLFITCMTSHWKAFSIGLCIISEIIVVDLFFFDITAKNQCNAVEFLSLCRFLLSFQSRFDDTTLYKCFILKCIEIHSMPSYNSCMNAPLPPKRVVIEKP